MVVWTIESSFVNTATTQLQLNGVNLNEGTRFHFLTIVNMTTTSCFKSVTRTIIMISLIIARK